MAIQSNNSYRQGFLPYALAAFLIGTVGGFSTVLGPSFVRDLGLSYQNTTWTTLAQAISTAACAPILGKLGDLLGRKTTLLAGMAVFTLGNLLSALANSLFLMLVARFLVGLGTAAMAPLIMAYIVAEFPANQTAQGFSAYMLISSASVIFGPTLGSLLIAARGWRAMMWVCVAICATVFCACLLTARGEIVTRKKPVHFDIAGAMLVILFFAFVLCIPSFGQNFGWHSTPFRIVLLLAAITFVGLLAAEARAVQPILSGRFLSRPVFLLSILALFLTQGLMQANMTNIIVLLDYTQPSQSVLSGYAISILYLGMSLGALILGPLADHHSAKAILIISLLLTGLSCVLLLPAAVCASLLMVALGVLGLGLGGSGTIFMKVALSDLPPQEAGVSAGSYGLFRDLASPFGVSVLVPLFTNRIADFIAAGFQPAAAAIASFRTLAVVEFLCVGGSIVAVLFLPPIKNKGASA